jgi:hypothetical protein
VATTSVSAAVDRQTLLDHFRTSFGAPGAVVVLVDGDGQWQGFSGSADVTGTELTNESRFRIGSITKSIVATLMLSEVGRGTVSLDDHVADLLPGVFSAEPQISVRCCSTTPAASSTSRRRRYHRRHCQTTDPRREQRLSGGRHFAGESVIVDRLFARLQKPRPYRAVNVPLQQRQLSPPEWCGDGPECAATWCMRGSSSHSV